MLKDNFERKSIHFEQIIELFPYFLVILNSYILENYLFMVIVVYVNALQLGEKYCV